MNRYPTLVLDERYYILGEDEARTPLRCLSRTQWDSFMSRERCVLVDQSLLARDLEGDVVVLTTFTGIDAGADALVHSGDDARPVLFETLVLGGLIDGHIVGSCTWQEALDTHTAVLHGLIPVLAEQKGVYA